MHGTRITAVRNAAAAPMGLFDERGQVSKKDLNYWWRHRAIPSSREQSVYCACDNMLGPDERLVSAYDLIRKRERHNSESDLVLCVRCCEELGIDFAYTAKPFKTDGMRPYDQLRLFSGHPGWLNPTALDGFVEAARSILAKNPNMPAARLDAVCAQLTRNIERLCVAAQMG